MAKPEVPDVAVGIRKLLPVALHPDASFDLLETQSAFRIICENTQDELAQIRRKSIWELDPAAKNAFEGCVLSICQLMRRGIVLLEFLRGTVQGFLSLEGSFPSSQFINENPETPHISLLVVEVALDDLRRDVV